MLRAAKPTLDISDVFHVKTSTWVRRKSVDELFSSDFVKTPPGARRRSADEVFLSNDKDLFSTPPSPECNEEPCQVIVKSNDNDFARGPSSPLRVVGEWMPEVESFADRRSSQEELEELGEWPEQSAATQRPTPLLLTTQFDPTTLTANDLCHIVLEIFEAAGLPELLARDLGRVKRFIQAVGPLSALHPPHGTN